MIEARDLVKVFEEKRALDGVNMHVSAGAVYGLVGPNGAGKSTLIRHLTGIYRQDSGEVLVHGREVFDNPEIKAEIAYIPDEIPFWSQATVNDMKQFYASLYPTFDTEFCERLQKEFCLDGKLMIRKLSKGQQKLAAFQFALAQRPRIVVLDEPVDGLDPVNRRAIWGILLGDVAERGTTVLVSSHNLRELEDVCDYVGIMNGGRMLLERSLSELQESIVKIQTVLPEGARLPEKLNVLHREETGRLLRMILRETEEEARDKLAECEPLFLDILPLTLEEIFIYELGGTDHEVNALVF